MLQAPGQGRVRLSPVDALGFVWLTPLMVVVPASLLTTGFGVRLAHHLTRRQLETAFEIFLVLVSVRFLVDFLNVGLVTAC